MRLLALLLLLTLPAFGRDEALDVTLVFGPNETPVAFTLAPNEARQFWLRWKELPATDRLVPVASENGGYRGLRIRTSATEEVRLYDGVGSLEREARADAYRTLERWVLEKAPPPLGPQLVAALDEQVGAAAPERAAPLTEKKAGAMIAACRKRAERSPRLRAMCLSEKLLESREPDVAVKALEQALRSTEAN